MQPGNQSLSKCGMRLFTIKVTMMQKYLKIGSLSTFFESIKRILLRLKMILKFNSCFCKYTLEPFKGRIIVFFGNFIQFLSGNLMNDYINLSGHLMTEQLFNTQQALSF